MIGAGRPDRLPDGSIPLLRHNLTTSRVEFIDDDRAQGWTYFMAMTRFGLDHAGRYIDTFCREGERWLIEDRRIVVGRHFGQTLGVTTASGHRARRPTQTQRVQRLDQPTVGSAATRHVNVGLAVEQHQNRHVRKSSATLVKAQIHGDRNATHGADLQVENHQIRGTTFDDTGHGASIATVGEGGVGSTEGGDDFVDQPVGIGCEDHVHGMNATRRGGRGANSASCQPTISRPRASMVSRS
ncbi:MAG: hypothetical protein EBY07_09205 [Actinobacteria bacterium]|nr:hypothetical protein [Actinomycetota bacterium]